VADSSATPFYLALPIAVDHPGRAGAVTGMTATATSCSLPPVMMPWIGAALA